ncbi:MAG TPA: hypothetical protein VHW45_14435 [Candidatus Sulfotelmatobacter sp.]|nr:hypothetical protein [Candidatus Sulfotelmatobacter sp.]
MPPAKGYAALRAKAAFALYSFTRREPREHDVLIDNGYCLGDPDAFRDPHLRHADWLV